MKPGSGVRQLVQRMLQARFIRGVAIIAGGSALAQAIPLLLTPVLTRIYHPGEMGMLAIYTSFISFAESGLTLGYSQAIVSGADDQEGNHLTLLSALLVGPMSIVGAMIFFTLSVEGWLGFGKMPLWSAFAMAVSLALTGTYFTLRYWLIRAGAYRIISTATVYQSIGRIGTQVITGLSGLGWVGLMFGEIVGRGSGLGKMYSVAREELGSVRQSIDVSTLRRVGRRHRKFPLVATPSSLINSLALVLPVPLLTSFYGIEAAGQFAISSRILLVPLSLVGVSVGDVFHNRIAQLSREDPDRALTLFFRVAGALFLVGLAPLLLVRVFGAGLFGAILGPDWRIAGSIASAIVPWVLMQFAVSPVSRVVLVYQGQEFKLVFDLLALGSVAGVLVLGRREGLSVTQTCMVLGWSQAVVYTIYFALLTRIMTKYRMVNADLDGEHSGVR